MAKRTNKREENQKSHPGKQKKASAAQEDRTSELLKVGIFGFLFLLYLIQFLQVEVPWHAPGPTSEPTIKRLTLLLVTLFDFPLLWTAGGQLPLGIFDRVPILFAAGLIYLVEYFLGKLLVDFFAATKLLTQLEHFLFSITTGLGLLSLWTLIVGLLGWLHMPLLVMIPVLLALIWSGKKWKSEWMNSIDQETDQDSSSNDPSNSPAEKGTAQTTSAEKTPWIFLLGIIPVGFTIVWAAMMPPSDFDVLEYHLQVPKEWYQLGQIQFLPHNVYAQMPMGAEMFALLAMIFIPGESSWLTGALVGKTVIGMFAPLSALAVYCAVKRFTQTQSAWIAASLLISTPWIAKVSATGLVDHVWGYYSFMALYAVLIWSFPCCKANEPQNETTSIDGNFLLLFAGLFAGFAVGTKYPALPLTVIPLFCWITYRSLMFAIRKEIKWQPLVYFSLAVVCASGLWFAKNSWQTGNPTYPLLASQLGGSTRDEAKIEQWQAAHTVPMDAQGNKYAVHSFLNGLQKVTYQSPWTSVGLFPLTMLAIFSPRRSLVLLLIGYLVYFFCMWYLVTHRIDRFLIPLIPVGCLLAGLGCQFLTSKLGNWLLSGIAAACLLFGFLTINGTFAIQIDNRIFVSLDALIQQQASEVNPAFGYLNKLDLSNNQQVMIVGQSAPFYLNKNYQYHTCFDDSPLKPIVALSPAERTDYFRSKNIAYLYIDWNEIMRYRSPGNYGYPEEVTVALIEELQQQQILGSAVFSTSNQSGQGRLIYPVIADE